MLQNVLPKTLVARPKSFCRQVLTDKSLSLPPSHADDHAAHSRESLFVIHSSCGGSFQSSGTQFTGGLLLAPAKDANCGAAQGHQQPKVPLVGQMHKNR